MLPETSTLIGTAQFDVQDFVSKLELQASYKKRILSLGKQMTEGLLQELSSSEGDVQSWAPDMAALLQFCPELQSLSYQCPGHFRLEHLLEQALNSELACAGSIYKMRVWRIAESCPAVHMEKFHFELCGKDEELIECLEIVSRLEFKFGS